MVRRILTVVLALGILFAFNLPAFPDGYEAGEATESSFQTQQSNQVEEVNSGNAWQEEQTISNYQCNTVSSGGGSSSLSGLPSLTDFALELYLYYVALQEM